MNKSLVRSDIFIAISSFIFKTLVKDTLKAFDDFKNKQKKVWSNVFWYVKVYIFWKCIQYITPWDKTQMLKNSFGQNKRCKKCPLFFFFDLQLITVLLLICDSYMSWSATFVSLQLCLEFPLPHPFRFY